MTTRNRRAGQLSDWGVLGLAVLVGIAVIALLVAAYAIGSTKGKADAEKAATTAPQGQAAATEPATTGATGADQATLALFSSTCGGCHTLAAAGTTGAVGPNLDELKPTEDQVLAAIENGGAGTGQMPPGLLSGADAQSVAKVVSSVAGG